MVDKCSECQSEAGQFGIKKIINCDTTGMNYCEDCHSTYSSCENEDCF